LLNIWYKRSLSCFCWEDVADYILENFVPKNEVLCLGCGRPKELCECKTIREGTNK
jgi:hypothetical protein